MSESAWLLAASLTFAASAHCLGMCGGFVLAIGAFAGSRRLRLLLEHVLLQVGKATTYAFLGTWAGAFGGAIIQHPAFQWGERALALVAGFGLGVAGLTLLGLRVGRSGALTTAIAGAWNRVVAPLLAGRPLGGSLVVGMALGLLPCPLVYAGLAAAAASGTPAAGAAILAGVALGTVPALTAVALFGATMPQSARAGLARAGGALLLLIALVTVARGFGAHAAHRGHTGDARPSALEHAHHASGAALSENAAHERCKPKAAE